MKRHSLFITIRRILFILAVSLSIPLSGMTGTLEFDGVGLDITSVPGEDIVIGPGLDAKTQVGTGGDANTHATTKDDFYITGILETDSTVYTESDVWAGDVLLRSISMDSTYTLAEASRTWQYLYVDTISGVNEPLSLLPVSGYNILGIAQLTGSGADTAYDLGLDVNKLIGGNYTGLLLNITESSAPGGANLIFDIQKNSVSALTLDASGVLYQYGNFYVSNGTPNFASESADPDMYVKGNVEVDGGIFISSMTYGLNECYDDGSTVATDNTDVIWNLTNGTAFDFQDNSNVLLRATDGGLLGIDTASISYELDTGGTIRTGRDGIDGQLRMYSEQGAPDYVVVFDPHAAMTQNTIYTLPPDDGDNTEWLLTDGAGNLRWSDTWIQETVPADFIRAKAGGIATDGATLWGTNTHTHINLGFGASATGAGGQNYSYPTLTGGQTNTASHDYATILGGRNNVANTEGTAVIGGSTNSATSNYAAILGGSAHTADSWAGTIAGGSSNTASARTTVLGGANNDAPVPRASVIGGYQNTISGDYSTISGGNWLETGEGSFGFRGRISNPAVNLDLSAQTNRFYIANANFHFNYNNADSDFRIDGDDNDNVLFVDADQDFVGFNRNDPSYEADVNGNARVTGLIYGDIAIGQPAGGWVDEGANIHLQTSTDEISIGINRGDDDPPAKLEVLETTEQLRLTHTDAAQFASFTVDGAGNLTLAPSGTDSNITGTLTVSSDLTANGSLAIDDNTTLGDAAADTMVMNADALTSIDATTWALADVTDSFNIDSDTLVLDALNNRIGIGTNTARVKLDMLDNANPQIRLTNTDSVDYAEFQTDANGDLYITVSNDEIFVDDFLKWGTHDTYDIGASGANRPRTAYFNGPAIAVDTANLDQDSLDFTGITDITTGAGGDMTFNPANNQDLIVSLSGTGDLNVNTNQLYVDTSTGFVGLGTNTPDGMLHVSSGDMFVSSDASAFANASGNNDVYVQGNLEVDGNVYLGNAPADSVTLGADTLISTNASAWTITDAVNSLNIDSNTLVVDALNNYVGIRTNTADRAMDILHDTLPQLRLTQTDALVYADMQASGSGDLTVTTTGDEIFVDDHLLFSTDNTYDVGALVSRARRAYFGTSIIVDTANVDEDSLDFTDTGEITTTGGLTLNPANNQNVNVTLSGTGDFIVNTNDLYVDTSTGFVGFSRTDPAYEADVSGDLNVTGLIYGDVDEGFVAGGWVDDGTQVRLETDTDAVGIGTTTADAKLEVLALTEQLRLTHTDPGQFAAFTVDGAGDLTIAPSGTDSDITGTLTTSSHLTAQGNWNHPGTTTLGNAGIDTITLGADTITSPDATAWTIADVTDSLNIDSDTLVVDALNNRLGIGTSTPRVVFDVLDNGSPQVRITNTDSVDYAEFQTDANGDLYITVSNDEIFVDDFLKWGTHDTYDIGASGANRPRTAYFNGPAIAVDTTNLDQDSLDFTGVATISTVGAGDLTLTPAATTNLNITLSGTGDLDVNTNQLYVDTSTGYVGLGTNTPDGMLHVSAGDVFVSSDASAFGNASGSNDVYVQGNLEVDGNVYLGDGAGDSVTMDADTIISPSAETWTLANVLNSLNIDSNTLVVDALNNRLGAGTSTPRVRFDILDAANPQLRITNADGVDYADVQTNPAGDLLINASGNDITLEDTLVWGAHNTYDIGASGANRPRTAYFNGPAIAVDTANLDQDSLDFAAAGNITTGAGGDLTLTPAGNTNLDITLSGTGDLVVNTDQLYVDTATGRVGLGTVTPDGLLHVVGDAYVSNDASTFDNPSAGEDTYVQGNLEVDGEVFIGNGITVSGGTVDFPDGSIDGDDFQNNTIDSSEIENNTLDFDQFEDTLDIDSTTEINFTGNNLNFDLDTTGVFQILDAGAVQHIFDDAGNVRLGDSDELYVDTAAGFVGIFDTTPNYTLDDNGDLNVTGEILGNLNAGSVAGGWVDAGAVVRLDTTADQVGIGTIAPDGSLHVTGDSFISDDDTSGFTHASAEEDLYVKGNLEVDGTLYSDNGITVSAGTVDFPDNSIPGDDFDSGMDSSEIADNILDFDKFQDTLDLDSTTQINLGANNFQINLDSTGDFQVLDAGVVQHIFYDNGDVRLGNNNELYVDTDVARVGIGTNTPGYTLDVTGDARATGSIYGGVFDDDILRDIVTSGTGLSGGANDVLYGPDSDVTITLTTAGDILASAPVTVASGTNVLPGSDAVDVTIGIGNDLITDTHLAYNTGQHLTTTSSPTFVDLNSIRYLYGDNGTIAQSTDEWLRLNPTGNFVNGIYTPGGLAAAGGLSTNSGYGFVAGEVRATLFRDTSSATYYVDPASTSVVNNLDVRGQIYNNSGDTRINDTLQVDGAGVLGVGIGTDPSNYFALVINGDFGPAVSATYVLGANTTASGWNNAAYCGAACGPDLDRQWNNLYAGTKSSIVPTSKSDETILYIVESPGVYFEDLGETELVNGEAKIPIEKIYKETVNTEKPYEILITPYGNCNGLYIAERTSDYFVVKERHGGTANIRFGYRILAERKGYEDIRFQDGHPDIPQEHAQDLAQK